MVNTNYRPDIDGLRAVAISSVVLFHLFPDALPNGFLGVDVFLVISGYLITGILLRDLNAGTFSILEFWARRIRRLFPVMAAVVIGTHIFAFFTLFGDEWESLSKQSLAALTSTANLFYWRLAGDYWGPTAESMPLLHTWSLAVEEQFYLLYPPTLWFLYRTFGQRNARSLILIVTICSFLLTVVMSTTHRAAAFYLLPTRAWELLIGCLLALLNTNTQTLTPKVAGMLPILGISLTLTVLCVPVTAAHLRVIQTAIAITGTTMILYKPGNQCGTPPRWLESTPAVFIGKISYSWYMWHWPLIVLAPKTFSLTPSAVLLVTLLAGAASWRFIENTTRFLPSRNFIVTSTILLLLACISLSTPYVVSRPTMTYVTAESPHNPNIQPPYIARFEKYSGDWKSGLTIGQLPLTKGNSAVLIGDSHGVMYFPAVLSACREHDLVLTSFAADGGTWPFFVADGTNPSDYYHNENSPGGWTPETRLQFDTVRREFLLRNDPAFVVLCGRWSFYYNHLRRSAFQQYFTDLLRELPESTNVVVIGQPPTLPFGAAGLTSGHLDIPPLRAIAEDPEERSHRLAAHSVISQLAADNKRMKFVPIDSAFETSRGLSFLESGTILYRDDDHLNSVGALKCTGSISAAFRTLLVPTP